ncbi:MAG: hypothetical protein ACRYG7_09070 [Janthinobacterium lividum]
MLKPNPNRDLTPVSQSSDLSSSPAEALSWGLPTAAEDLPATLGRLRDAQRQVNRLVQDAEARAIHFLRHGPLAGHHLQVKTLIERFYPFSEEYLRRNYAQLDGGIVNENIHLLTLATDYSFWKGFTLDWQYISAHRPVPLAMLERYADKWNWSKIAANPLIDWNVKSLRRHFRRLTAAMTALSANQGINWTPELLRTFATDWDYSADGLLSNDALPWEDDTFPALLLKLAPAEAELDLEEVTGIAVDMRQRSWERRSLNRHLTWTADDLHQYTSELDWNRLSANPALPFSFTLLTEFAAYWDWTELSANPGFYEKLLTPLLSDAVVHEFLLLTAP